MTNFEHYRTEIQNAFSRYRFLDNSLNDIEDVTGETFSNMNDFIEWGYCEYKESIEFTELDRQIIEQLYNNTRYAYIARDSDDALYAYIDEPHMEWNDNGETRWDNYEDYEGVVLSKALGLLGCIDESKAWSIEKLHRIANNDK